MTADRAKLELDQLTERLLASRERPKRQYLIDQIGRIWFPPIPGCGLIRTLPGDQHHQSPQRLHHFPTEQSVDAVASFSTDPSPYVRTAVAHAFAGNRDAAHQAIPAIRNLLFDSSPTVRITAARSVFQTGIGALLDREDSRVLLRDDVWSVRWAIAGSLSGTSLHNEAWRALANSIPRGMFFLDFWSEYAERFSEDLSHDASVRDTLHQYKNKPVGKSFGYHFDRLMATFGNKSHGV